ncbi:MAG: hypothetical protein IJ743_00590 [Bacilli bacterium]|nr:hypothetical protein [Methanobrevibacter sp.]MBR1748273.1 hypothetical protein [Bacilli bacterium]
MNKIMLISPDCKACRYCDESLEFPCTLNDGTEIRCNILKAYKKREMFVKMIKGA